MAVLFTLRVFAKNPLIRKSQKMYLLYFVLMSGLGLNRRFTSNNMLPTRLIGLYIKMYSFNYYYIYKKRKRHTSIKDRTASKGNKQPFIEYCSVRTQVYLILSFVYMYGELWRVEINNIICVVRCEYVE